MNKLFDNRIYKDSQAGRSNVPGLYKRVKERIFKESVRPLLSGGGEMPSKKELAARYGVNVGTLDKALQELAHEGYIEKRVGSGTYVLPRGTHGLGAIGIYTLSPRIAEDWKPALFKDRLNICIQENLVASGLEFRHYADMRLDSATDKAPVTLIDDINRGKVSSIIAFGFEGKQTNWLRSLGVPVIGDNYDFGWGAVSMDMHDAGFTAASALISVGSSKIELLSAILHEWLAPDKGESTNRPLRAGIANALRNAGYQAQEYWLKPGMLPSDLYPTGHGLATEEVGYEVCKTMFRNCNPDGIVVYTDVLAIGVARALKEKGLRPGKDIQVAVLCNEGIDFPELAGFIRMELSIKEFASSLITLALAAERDEAPREIRVRYKIKDDRISSKAVTGVKTPPVARKSVKTKTKET